MSFDVTTLALAKSYTNQHSGGGGQVQPDWNQNDSTQPDYVKNRPFYTATDETVLVEESTVSFADTGQGFYGAEFSSTFEATVGETYKVSWDGTTYECTCVDFSGNNMIGNLSIAGLGSDTGEPFVMQVVNGKGITIITLDTSASHTFSIIGFVQEVVKIDEKYLPDTVATKSEVEATQKVLDGAFSSVATFTFDKQTSGKDIVVFNAFYYYKISDFNPAPEDVISFKGTTEFGTEYSEINIGNNCVEYGRRFIIVASAGSCSLPITETVTKSFTAPSAGLYAMYTIDNPNQTAGTAEFIIKPSSGSSYITGLLLKSCTHGSTKKFRITVDDDYNVSATNTSDSVSKALATTEYVDNSVSNPLNITSATVGQIAKIASVDDSGKPTEWEAVDMPDKLPNPKALTFTGAVTGSYDGSEPMTVEIPSGGYGGGGISAFEKIGTIDLSTMAASNLGVDFTVTDVTEILLIWTGMTNTMTSNSSLLLAFNSGDLYNVLGPQTGKSGSPLNGYTYLKILEGVGLLPFVSPGANTNTNYAPATSGATNPYNLLPVKEKIQKILIRQPTTQYYADAGIVEVYVR